MFNVCVEELKETLKKAGIKTQIYTNMAALKATSESHIGAVLSDGEKLTRNGSKRTFTDETGTGKKRKKIFDRDLTFNVVIGEYSREKADEIYSNFLAELKRGIYVDGNYVYIEPEKSEWVEKEDSILRAKIAVQVKIVFKGGIYKDTELKRIKDTKIEVIKEGLNGS